MPKSWWKAICPVICPPPADLYGEPQHLLPNDANENSDLPGKVASFLTVEERQHRLAMERGDAIIK